jgi:DNA topoisomerase VI subunit B
LEAEFLSLSVVLFRVKTEQVHRFANRIPLLFEAGSDVATRVANKRIKWASYKIDAKKDKVGELFHSLSPFHFL